MSYYEIQNVYEEHISSNALEYVLRCTEISEYFYILHNKDINELGVIKKPHYHILLNVDLPTKHNECKQFLISLFQLVDINIRVVNVKNINAFARYLTHKDNPLKYQYSDSEIITNCLSSYYDYIEKNVKLSNSDLIINTFVDRTKTDFDNFIDITSDVYILLYFKSINKLSYYLQHYKALKELVLNLYDIYNNNTK